MKKRLLAILLALMIVVLCGCGKSEAAKVVDDMISAIGTVTLQSEAQIVAAEKAYAALTEEQKGEIENNAILVAARATLDGLLEQKAAEEAAEAEAARIAEVKRKAAKIDAKIKAIGTVTLDSADAIAAARSAYDEADAEVQRYTSQVGVLTEAENQLSKLRTQRVADMIDAIGTVTLESGPAIQAAEDAWNALTTDERMSIIDKADVLTSAKYDLNNLQEQEAKKLLAKMTVESDPVRGIKFYYPSAFPYYKSAGYWGADVRSFVLPYMGVQGERVWLRLVCDYTADDWIFFKKLTFAVDDQRFYKSFNYFDVTRDNDSGDIWEYVDIEVNATELKMLEAIANSTTTIVRFEGDDYYRDVTISANDKKAIREMLTAYYALGGK